MKLFSRSPLTKRFAVFFAFLPFFSAHAQSNAVWAIPKPEMLGQTSPFSLKDTALKAELRIPPDSVKVAATPFIVGGSTASRGEFPEYSLLLVDGLDGYLYPSCGGTLISANKILTAAHCSYGIAASHLYAIPGFYTTSEASAIIPVSAKKEHPAYSNSTLVNDIAILTLASNSSKPKAKIYGGNKSLARLSGTVVGLGKLDGDLDTPNTLQKVNLPIVSNSTCAQVWGTSSIKSSMLCAGGTASGGIGACSGDSGGPMFTTISDEKTQVGVVSWGEQDCATAYYYDVYTRISEFVSFISANAPGVEMVYASDFNIAPVLLLLDDDTP